MSIVKYFIQLTIDINFIIHLVFARKGNSSNKYPVLFLQFMMITALYLNPLLQNQVHDSF